MSLKNSYTKAVKRYDIDLYCDHAPGGTLCVFRKTKRFIPVCATDDFRFLNLVEDKQLVFALTDNWTMRGKPRAWGIDFVLNRLGEIDVQANERFFEELDEQNERIDASKDRALRNELESFWIDNRKSFQKATNDILIHSMSKDEPRKRLKDRSIKNGNSK